MYLSDVYYRLICISDHVSAKKKSSTLGGNSSSPRISLHVVVCDLNLVC